MQMSYTKQSFLIALGGGMDLFIYSFFTIHAFFDLRRSISPTTPVKRKELEPGG